MGKILGSIFLNPPHFSLAAERNLGNQDQATDQSNPTVHVLPLAGAVVTPIFSAAGRKRVLEMIPPFSLLPGKERFGLLTPCRE